MRALVWLRDAVLSVTAVIGVVCVLLLGASFAFDVKSLVVVSGSMEPGIPTGSLILSRMTPASEIVVGDVVTVPKRTGAELVTHRVVEVAPVEGVPEGRELTLRGDANDVDDPYTYGVTVAGKHLLTIPGGGYVVSFFQSRDGVVATGAAILVVVVLLVGTRGETRQSVRRARRGTPLPDGAAHPSVPASGRAAHQGEDARCASDDPERVESR
ncbi:signal peptidase I [Oerskovia enterophila]|uniref:signal peptidase I n=1 Tax=Oerskovia enterophila TaxID=43678 RepID=UPI0037F6ACE4